MILPVTDMLAAVAEVTQLPVSEIAGTRETRRRFKRHCRARQAVTYLARQQIPPHSYPQIGRHLGGMDHTSALAQHRAADELMDRASFRILVDAVNRGAKARFEARRRQIVAGVASLESRKD